MVSDAPYNYDNRNMSIPWARVDADRSRSPVLAPVLFPVLRSRIMDAACGTVRHRNEQSAVHGVRLGGAVSALGVSNLDGRLSAPGDSVIDDVIDAGDKPLKPDSAVDFPDALSASSLLKRCPRSKAG
jgi:hypothetical protein